MTARTFRYRQTAAAATETIQRFIDNVNAAGYSDTLSVPVDVGGGLYVDLQLDPYTPLRLSRLDAKMDHIGFTRVARTGTPQQQSHDALSSLAHFIANPPASGFGSEVFYSQEGPKFLPTSKTWWRDADLTVPIFDVHYVRRGGLLHKAHYRAFDTDGVPVAGLMDICDGIGQAPRRIMSTLLPESIWWQERFPASLYSWTNPTGKTLYAGNTKMTFVFWVWMAEWPTGEGATFFEQSGGNGSVYMGQDGSNRSRWYVGSSDYANIRPPDMGMPGIVVAEIDFSAGAVADLWTVHIANAWTGAAFVQSDAYQSGGSYGSWTTVTGWDNVQNNNPRIRFGKGIVAGYSGVLIFPGMTLTDAQRDEILLPDTINGHPQMRDPLLWSWLVNTDFWLQADGKRTQQDGSIFDIVGLREFAPEVAA